MNPAPLPQPAARTCPNCGAAVDAGAALCPNCGAAMAPVAMAAAPNGCLIVAAQIFLGLLALIFGLGGSCVVLLSGIEGGVSSSENRVFVFLGVLAVALAGACIWGIIRLGKTRQ